MESRELAEKIVSILEEKKAKDLNIIDIREISILADYFVICSGTSTTHIKTLADEVEEKMLEAGIELLHKEGYNSARWILLDYGEVVVHIFHEEDRQFYNLERLWADGVMKHRQ
ncbi:MAG TPA: ribosome silencing factor [Acetivibrio thermocellus]|uniref:ribosome silencing factor n=1 Tax=Acetivibrio thermocellus TaxID=1515 RepID=UPI00017E2151|nr:ribosome silencing factor [Acetivibrio thermocellus]NLU27443.1 ribosome silencing factor [Acetivibrio thermocellus]THJ79019.1 ribosome silencing factor [Acetivibrio thermocellus]CDG35908.1 iojap-like protein [Acetivibrio thermocellus BC1]HOP92793.1 ribosome silencing factor [Acetivibrio thermocellus]